MRELQSFIADDWQPAGPQRQDILSAITNRPVARADLVAPALDLASEHARHVGGPALRKMSFHARARMLKALATHLNENRTALYELSYQTGTTLRDAKVDIDGGIGTLFYYASMARRTLPDGQIYLDGAHEPLGREGSFVGQHIFTSRPGLALHINAFNFPVWGMLEKLAPALIAGQPCLVKPATVTAYLTEAAFRLMLQSGALPEGAVQLLIGRVPGLVESLGAQDTLAFTGSARTAGMLREKVSPEARFMAEQDSLNAAILGPEETDETRALFIKEVVREMTVKAGQKCTAIRRILVPGAMYDQVRSALCSRLANISVGDPRLEAVGMGALVSQAQRRDVLNHAGQIGQEAGRLFGDPDGVQILGEDVQEGAFMAPLLYGSEDPDGACVIHEIEAFGPVATLMPYRDTAHAAALAQRGGGSLVASLFTESPDVAREMALNTAAWHGRLYINQPASARESTGHGAPIPHLVHGGPGRAGGGEELGGIRGVLNYMQRSAIQGSPEMIRAIGGVWIPGAARIETGTHPFRRSYDVLEIGETFTSGERVVTLEDIEHFADFTGDRFYAHMDDEAARANPFFPGRVAHGYLLLSFAAGLFVDPDPGPVLANTGLDGLRFVKPVAAGEAISVQLTVSEKTPRRPDYGAVRWHVQIVNGEKDLVAEYALLTMNATHDAA